MTPDEFRQQLLVISQSVPLDIALGGLLTMILALTVAHYPESQQEELVAKLARLLHIQLATARAVHTGEWPESGLLN